MLPPRRYERLARLLLRLIDETLEPDVAVADRRRRSAAPTASRRPRTSPATTCEAPARLSPRAVMDWMDLAGYGATLASNGNGETVIEVHNCVYRELSQEFPDVVCAFDRSMLCGMLGVDAVGPHADARAQRRRHVLPARVPALARDGRASGVVRPAPAP